MLSKLIATFCAWVLAPLSMLFLLYIPVYLYWYLNGDNQGSDDFKIMAFILMVSYIITAVVGLTTHAALLYWRKDTIKNYALIGGGVVLFYNMLVVIIDGVPQSGFSQAQLGWFFVLMSHSLVVATSFAIIYKNVYGLLTKPQTNLGMMT